jgi:DNA-binding LytR/AlgR family response regulator
MNMKQLMEKLPAKDFIRVHRSYVIPLKRIESVRGKNINIGITEIPIGVKYEEAFFKVYTSENYF